MGIQPYTLMPASEGGQVDEWMRLGLEAQVAGKFADAERFYRNALRLNPMHAYVTQNYAVLCAQQEKLIDALLAIERATLNGGGRTGIIWANWALMSLEAQNLETALRAARMGVEVEANAETRTALAMVLTASGHADQAIPVYEEILADPHKASANAIFLAGFNSCFIRTLTAATPAETQEVRKRWYAANRFTGIIAPHQNDRSLDRALRVGYVSGDFKRHSASFLFGAVVLHHNKTMVTPYCYSALPVDAINDPHTAAFVKETVWRDISRMENDEADRLIRQDGIDILVDLSGHTGGNRLSLFTRKPAPIQVTAWGFAHGTGVKDINYFFADPLAVPAEERQHYAEAIWDLPCIVPYQPPTEYKLAGTSALPVNKSDDGWITFGAFSRFEKLSNDALATWAEILHQVPQSRLLLKDKAFNRPDAIRRIWAAMPGVDPARLIFSLDSPHPDHLMAYHQADLILDPFPHTGGVVGIEQLYMGVPVITLYGNNPGERTTSCVLTAMGCPEWIARSKGEYIALAVRMANDRPALVKARQSFRHTLMNSPVCDGTYVRAVEDAYRQMWQKWCAA